MAKRSGDAAAPQLSDFRRLPDPIDLDEAVETHDVDPVVHAPESKFATPEIEELTRTGAIGGGF